MEVLHQIQEIKSILKPMKLKEKTIAFVPTMGALHKGHLELLKQAQKYGNIVVLSIFVNPTQFGANEDFDKYPRNLEQDIQILQTENIHVDYLFVPSIEEMYPFSEKPELKFPFLSQKLCGISRPTHFDGVGLVVLKLLNIVQPDYLIMGQKDFQQTVIIQRLIQEFFLDTQLIVVPTVREKNGLALSSRNQYLTAEQKNQALILYNTLQFLSQHLYVGMTSNQIISLLQQTHSQLTEHPYFRLDYLEILNANTLQEIEKIQAGDKILIAIAGYIGSTRLIDNFVIQF
jgi:pantoate--beta-alanine ligase